MSNQPNLVNQVVAHLKSKFEITTSKPDTFVGLEINFIEGELSMRQSCYIKSIIERFKLDHANPVDIPLPAHIKLDEQGVKGSESKEAHVPYRQLLGSLNYASTTSRPDITYSVNLLARFSQKPRLAHWHILKNILRYLITRENYGLINKRSTTNELDLCCYTDSDFAGCQVTKRSTSGVVVYLNSHYLEVEKTNCHGHEHL